MAFPVAAGHPQLEGNYIPMKYAKKMLGVFYAMALLTAITNTDYQGDITDSGSQVTIRTLPEFPIHDYQKGMDIIPDNVESEPITFAVERGWWFAAMIEDLDRLQSDLNYEQEWLAHGARKMQERIDRVFFGDVYSDVSEYNAGLTAGKESGAYNLGVTGTPLAFTSELATDIVTQCFAALDEQNVPKDNRYIVVPAVFAQRIKNSDLKVASLTGDNVSPLRTGVIGKIDGATFYESNLLTSVVDGGHRCFNCVFGQKDGIASAFQMTKSEKLRHPTKFGDVMRSLTVGDWKVVRPEAVGHLYAYAA